VLALEDDKLACDGTQTLRANLLPSSKDRDALDVAIDAEDILRDILNLELLADEPDTAGLANKMLRVEKQGFRSCDVLVSDRVSTCLALVSKQLVEVGLAIWFLVLDHELATDERLRATRANKMLRMVGLSKGVHALANDHLTTISTWRTLVDDVAPVGGFGGQNNRFVNFVGVLLCPLGSRSAGSHRCCNSRSSS
jgi:hypothetical protein